MKTPEELIKVIKEKGHWVVNIRPQKHHKELLPLNATVFKDYCEGICIKQRGWDYPVVPDWEDGATKSRIDCGIQVCNELRFPEIWRLKTSGNFYQLFGLREDYVYEYTAVYGKGKVFSVSSAFYTLTEIFQFAKRMFNLREFTGQEPFIEIKLTGLKDRMLILENFGGIKPTNYVCITENEKEIFKEAITSEELMLNAEEYALKAFKGLMWIFNWEDPPMDVMKDEQQKFLKGKV